MSKLLIYFATSGLQLQTGKEFFNVRDKIKARFLYWILLSKERNTEPALSSPGLITYLTSIRSHLFPAMATTILGGPCCRSSFTQFFNVENVSCNTKEESHCSAKPPGELPSSLKNRVQEAYFFRDVVNNYGRS